MEMKSVPMLVPPSKPTPFETIPFTRGSVMAGLNTLTTSHVLIFKPDKDLGGARPADIVRSGLSQVLVPYYPLAGRIVENETGWEVQCDGQGAVYIVTTVPDFEEIVVQPSHMDIATSFEPETVIVHPSRSPLPAAPAHSPTLVVQVTEVETGGFILSIKLYKGICDAAGFIHFLCGWAEMARGKPHVSVLPIWGDKTRHKDSFSDTLDIDKSSRYQTSLPINPIAIDENTRHQVHLPNLEKQATKLIEEGQGTFSCQHHSKIYKAPITEKVKVDIPFEVIKAHTEWMLVEERISCTALQILMAHVWRERTRALHIPSNVETRLFFMSKAEQHHPIAFYGSFAFNCQAKARAEDLMDMPLVYTLQLIQEAEANLEFNFTTCTNEFKQVHCSCGFVPMEVLLFTSLPTTNVDTHLDFGALGKPLTSSLDDIHFPSNVNIAAIVPSSHAYESNVHIVMNNVPFVHVNDLLTLLCSMPLYAPKGSKM
ncbi:hypothetical protein GOP47_0002428 [Adiantum capillus-veneris]|uniref:Uncharacterized protein n=1 Tax=Adiantum capillus-veneris TaxID=13818 RepID=A0A9D4VAX7_ADICA|nr:hypothetical protein GOP47_0002428 [Adiantum capillus-veneris]